MALTDIAIRNAKPRPKPYKLADALGLFLLVQPSGGKLWRLKYRVDGREKKLGFGTYPEVSLSDARKSREEAREQLAAGKDPSREKQRDKVRSRIDAGKLTPAVSTQRRVCSLRRTASADRSHVDGFGRFQLALLGHAPGRILEQTISRLARDSLAISHG